MRSPAQNAENFTFSSPISSYSAESSGDLDLFQGIDRTFKEIEESKCYIGKVVSITQFGAFMEVLPCKDGLVHVSELAEGRTENVGDIVKKGDTINAKCLGVDEKGRVKMSRRAWLRDQKAAEHEAQHPVAAE